MAAGRRHRGQPRRHARRRDVRGDRGHGRALRADIPRRVVRGDGVLVRRRVGQPGVGVRGPGGDVGDLGAVPEHVVAGHPDVVGGGIPAQVHLMAAGGGGSGQPRRHARRGGVIRVSKQRVIGKRVIVAGLCRIPGSIIVIADPDIISSCRSFSVLVKDNVGVKIGEHIAIKRCLGLVVVSFLLGDAVPADTPFCDAPWVR